MNHRIYTSSHKNNAIVIKNNLKDLGDKSLKKLEILICKILNDVGILIFFSEPWRNHLVFMMRLQHQWTLILLLAVQIHRCCQTSPNERGQNLSEKSHVKFAVIQQTITYIMVQLLVILVEHFFVEEVCIYSYQMMNQNFKQNPIFS